MAQKKQQPHHTRVTNPVSHLWTNWKKAAAKNPKEFYGKLGAVVLALVLIIVAIIVAKKQYEIYRLTTEQNKILETYDFNPGNIISDADFFNSNAMTAPQIQSFLDEHGADCTDKACLRSATFETTEKPNDDLCSGYAPTKSKTASAAEIVDSAARSCGISQSVLLTMLQKEQGLVTTTDTSAYKFDSALGLSCPDDAACDVAYKGFFNQVYGAAHRFKYYQAHPDDYSYHAYTINTVAYSPTASCGSAPIYIENKATALLYIYTPYQPNTAALKAGWGEGNTCSTYGNRNFSLFYQAWFQNKTF